MRSSALFFLFCFLVFGGSVRAQNVPGSSREVYEGQTVSAVDIIANPRHDMDSLRRFVAQKVGQPYSEADVEASIAALQRAGFEKVAADAILEPTGLRLNFIVESPYYLGIIEFPEAAKYFSYTRLLQVTNFADQDPYDPARLPVAEEGLRHFLERNGYFQAQVHAEPRIDDSLQLVNITFSVQMGKRAHIGSIEVQGSGPEQARLLHSVRSLRARLTGALLKPGKPYTAERIKAATALIKRSLIQQHRLASTVREDPPQYHAENNRVDVSFQIELGPVVMVRVTGARLSAIPFMSGRLMNRLIPVFSEGAIDRDLVEEGQQNLVDYFQKKGYFDAQVKTDFQRQPDRISLVYEIDRGKKHRVDSIAFHGNRQIPEKELLAQVVVKKSRIWNHGSISQKLLKQSKDNLQALYRDRGYEEVKVSPKVVNRELKLAVTFEIDEGQQTLVDSVQVTGNSRVPYAELAAPKGFHLQGGAPFSSRRLSEDRNRISATYLNRGYLNAEVKPAVVRHQDNPHLVDITYAVTEGQMVRVSDVVYLGEKRTRLSLLHKTAQIPRESPMSRGQLLAAESRLYDLNIFDWSSVGPRRPIVDQTDEEALVKVHEAKRNEITYGVGFEVSHRGASVPSGSVAVPGGGTIGLGGNQIASSQSTYASPRGSMEFIRRNIRGLGEAATISLLLSRLDQREVSTYAQPHFLNSQWSSLTSFSIERTTENPLFAAGLGDLSFQVEKLVSRKTNTRLQLRYDFNKTMLSHLLVPDLVLPQDRNIHLSTLSGTLIRDTRDKPLDAHHGVFATLNVGITPVALGSSANFAKFLGQYAFYKPFHSVVFANSLRLGLAKAFAGSFVPTSQLFFSGGGTSLRSFPINEAGPQRVVPFCTGLKNQTGCVNVTVPVGGRQLFILNSEVRFPMGIMKALGGVVFYDGGNVYSGISFGSFARNYTNTIGIGLRYSTPIGPIRIDFGHNLNPVPGINRNQYYITLGQAF